MMKREITQNEGVNQVALINSENNQITIINDPNEYINLLFQQGKYIEAADVFAKLYNQMGRLHPLYPNYIYKPVNLGQT